jgi:hypothetical protein
MDTNAGLRAFFSLTGGEGGIRTREAGFSRLHTFQACSFNHSDTSPEPGLGVAFATPKGSQV